MNRQALKSVASLFALVLFLTSPPLYAQGSGSERTESDSERERIISGIINATLDREHYNPLELDRNLSNKAFELYIDRLDPAKQFLLVEDVRRLRVSQDDAAAGLSRGDFSLLNEASVLLDERVTFIQEAYEEMLAKPFDFTANETVVTNIDSLEFAASETELRDRWRKSLKYQVMLRYLGMVDTEKRDKAVFHADLEEKAREQVRKNTGRSLDRIRKLGREDHLARYVNAVINVFDPHTEYYPPLDKENFDIGITGRLEGIGAQLREEDGYIKVIDIVPGSASWRGKELEAEDIILKVAQKGEEPADVVGVPVDDAVKLIRGPKGTTVILTVKKPDGRIKSISIVRDVVVLEETYAKGVIIEGAKFDRRFGYIDLPKFYTDFNRDGAPRASDDVRRILKQFKEAGVDGVVLDLRNNGGGSLQEAVDIAGLFIKTGPVVQVQDRHGNRQVLGDMDKDIVWDGDLVVMVNSFSASASEILSAMLQDYDRGVIVGSPTTFGKGTVQRFFDLDDRLSSRYNRYAPLGSVKVTTQKFYRVNGVSTQFNGVVPDVILPDVFSYRSLGERSLDYPLAGDTISSTDYRQWLSRDIPAERLAEASESRIRASRFFQLVQQRAEQLREEQGRASESLDWKSAQAEQDSLEAASDAIEKAVPDLSWMEFSELSSEDANEMWEEMMKEFREGLRKDVYLDEALSILNDMHSLSIEYGWTLHQGKAGE